MISVLYGLYQPSALLCVITLSLVIVNAIQHANHTITYTYIGGTFESNPNPDNCMIIVIYLAHFVAAF